MLQSLQSVSYGRYRGLRNVHYIRVAAVRVHDVTGTAASMPLPLTTPEGVGKLYRCIAMHDVNSTNFTSFTGVHLTIQFKVDAIKYG